MIQKFLISNNLQLLNGINSRLNNYMKSKDRTYNAEKWGNIYKHQSKDLWALDLGTLEDVRDPFSNLSNAEILEISDGLEEGWLPPSNHAGN